MENTSAKKPIFQMLSWGIVVGLVGIATGQIVASQGTPSIVAPIIGVIVTLLGFVIGSMGVLSKYEKVDLEATEAKHEAIHDPLTQLLNRAGLMDELEESMDCLLYTSPSPRDRTRSRMPSSA